MIVLLIGDTNGGRNDFYNFVSRYANPGIYWINNSQLIDYSGINTVLYFGGPINLPQEVKTITWSGNHVETLHRVYKTLGLE